MDLPRATTENPPAAPPPAAADTSAAPDLASGPASGAASGAAPHRRKTRLFLGALLLLFLIWEASGFFFAYTDDALLWGDLVSIAPRVGGQIDTVAIRDDQSVAAGDLLFTIDAKPYRLALDQASDALAGAEAQLSLDQASQQSALALQSAAAAQSALAAANLKRASSLTASGFEAAQGQEEAATAARRAAAALAAAQDAVLRANRMLRLDQTAIARAESALALAHWQLNRTRVTAPLAGRITHFNLRRGDEASAGQPLVALVAAGSWYVTANYKEGVLRHLVRGKRAWVWLDTHPFHLYRAQIEGVAAAVNRHKAQPTGLLPYIDPGIDWIRLQARFPVRLRLLDPPPEAELFMGSDARVLVIY
ncbi:HlyD family secretion protein [Acidisoma sp. C75]